MTKPEKAQVLFGEQSAALPTWQPMVAAAEAASAVELAAVGHHQLAVQGLFGASSAINSLCQQLVFAAPSSELELRKKKKKRKQVFMKRRTCRPKQNGPVPIQRSQK